MLGNPTFRKTARTRLTGAHQLLVSAILLLAVVVGILCAWLMLQTVAGYYAARIYPNVSVLGLDLGRLTPAEAAAVLDGASHEADPGLLVLRDAENRWSVPWSEAGMRFDVAATVQAAFAVGHADTDLRMRERVRLWLRRHDVAPVFAMDVDRAREMLERLAPGVAVPPVDATLRLEGDQVVVVPGQPGRELDLEATLARLLAVADGEERHPEVELQFKAVKPRVTDVTPLQAQAEELLDRRVTLTAYDLLTDETFTWTVGRREIATWLSVLPSPQGPTLELDQEAVRATLRELAAGLGDGRGLRVDEAVEQVLATFDAGGGGISLYLTHPRRSHVVRSGDSLSRIADAFGVPAWLILQANPELDPDWLHVGQELTIPSQDRLTPFMPVPDKRVVVDIARQRLRAYEGGQLRFDWPVSTGVAESPTHTGTFQVLGKEQNAYASLWDLWMPHFVSIYPAGPDFYNGFHGLPTLSSGRRLWEGLLGSPASYGCIILGLEEAEAFFHWAEVGVPVVIR